MAKHHTHGSASARSQLVALIENLPDMAYRCGNHPDRPMDYVSDGCTLVSGYSRSDFEQQHVLWGTLIHLEDRDRIWHITQAAVEADEAFEYEYRIYTKDNQERWVWERGRRSTDTNDDLICLEGIISDVTGRKLVENDIADIREFANAVVDTAAEAIIMIDGNGAIETFNRSAQLMFDYSFEEIHGKNIRILMPEPDSSEHNGYIMRYLETNEPRIIGTGREVRAQRKDGSIFPIHLSVSEVHNHSERKFVGLIRDISLQRDAEHAAREHLEQLAHVDRLNMLGEMATGIAHEINQPLTAISLFSQAGKRLLEADSIEKLPDIFDKLSQHAQRAGDIIERMQTMARHGENAREIVDCNDLVAEVAKLAEAEARIRDIVINVETGDGSLLVDVDAVQIQQVALNLLRNGMEAMRSIDCAGGNAIILRTGRRSDGDVEVLVIDSGCGVSQEVAQNIFAPFSTTKTSGMGMGLSLSRTIITAHGGQLDFRNNESDGATFFFTLPAAR